KLLRHARVRAAGTAALQNASGSADGDVRVHRGLLQSAAPAFGARAAVADGVRAGLCGGRVVSRHGQVCRRARHRQGAAWKRWHRPSPTACRPALTAPARVGQRTAWAGTEGWAPQGPNRRMDRQVGRSWTPRHSAAHDPKIKPLHETGSGPAIQLSLVVAECLLLIEGVHPMSWDKSLQKAYDVGRNGGRVDTGGMSHHEKARTDAAVNQQRVVHNAPDQPQRSEYGLRCPRWRTAPHSACPGLERY